VRRMATVVFLVAAVATACSSSKPSSFTPDFPKPPSYDQLITQAALDPCPPSSTTHPPKSLPDVTLPCLGHGPAVHLAGLSGTPTVVNIWGSWCGPCQAETKYLSTVYDGAHGKVRFLGVDTEDDAKSALDFAPHVTPPMHYPQVVDKNKSVLIGLNTPSAVPTTVFVDAAGRVVHVEHVAYTSAASLRADIRRYLGVAA
jgi:cytochrome c biogenesis protein CcmG, thiol:disulfide interchange protein DsbE